MKNIWNINEFCDVINMKLRKWILFNNNYCFDIYVCSVDLQTICAK
jgi:hypothetical protein